MNTRIAFWNILRKDMKTYYLKPPNISWGLIFPFAWMLMFYLRSQTALDIRELLPGVVSMSILFGTTSMLAVTITFERRSRSFERLLLAPIDLSLLMMAKTGGAVMFGVLNAFVPIGGVCLPGAVHLRGGTRGVRGADLLQFLSLPHAVPLRSVHPHRQPAGLPAAPFLPPSPHLRGRHSEGGDQSGRYPAALGELSCAASLCGRPLCVQPVQH